MRDWTQIRSALASDLGRIQQSARVGEVSLTTADQFAELVRYVLEDCSHVDATLENATLGAFARTTDYGAGVKYEGPQTVVCWNPYAERFDVSRTAGKAMGVAQNDGHSASGANIEVSFQGMVRYSWISSLLQRFPERLANWNMDAFVLAGPGDRLIVRAFASPTVDTFLVHPKHT